MKSSVYIRPSSVVCYQSPNSIIAVSESSSLVTRDVCPLPRLSSTSSTLPVLNRRVSPSPAVTSHSPVKTKNMLRAGEEMPVARPSGRCLHKTKSSGRRKWSEMQRRRGRSVIGQRQVDFNVLKMRFAIVVGIESYNSHICVLQKCNRCDIAERYCSLRI